MLAEQEPLCCVCADLITPVTHDMNFVKLEKSM